MAGRYEEILTPDMMVEDPVYHLHANGLRIKLEGQEKIKDLYRVWAATNQSVFYTESEEVSVSNHCITSMAVGYHQVSGRSLLENPAKNPGRAAACAIGSRWRLTLCVLTRGCNYIGVFMISRIPASNVSSSRRWP